MIEGSGVSKKLIDKLRSAKTNDIIEVSHVEMAELVGASKFSTWQVTASLRWNGSVLEQAWQDVRHGHVEWRPVEHIIPTQVTSELSQ